MFRRYELLFLFLLSFTSLSSSIGHFASFSSCSAAFPPFPSLPFHAQFCLVVLLFPTPVLPSSFVTSHFPCPPVFFLFTISALCIPDMELGHILWPSDTGIQWPGDPFDPVTLLNNELQMSTYVADKRLQWARGFASFYRCLGFARLWEVKLWRSFVKCQYFNDGWTDFHKNIYLYIFILGFRKPEKLGSHTG